jgi:hypothetical protein
MGSILIPIKHGKDILFHDLLYQKLLNIKKIQKLGWDCQFIIVGDERSGKSTLGIQCGYILSNGKISIENIAPTASAAIEKLEDLPDESVLIIDEGSLMFSSKDTMKKEQRQLIKILNVVGQKKMVLIVILPDFFDLNKYISVFRSRFLIKVYADKNLRRGRFMYWGSSRKKILYEYGKKHYGSYKFPKSNFKGRFTSFNPIFKEYEKLKVSSLWAALKSDDKIASEPKTKAQRDVLINQVYRRRWMKQKHMEKLFMEHGCILTRSNISKICTNAAKKSEKPK